MEATLSDALERQIVGILAGTRPRRVGSDVDSLGFLAASGDQRPRGWRACCGRPMTAAWHPGCNQVVDMKSFLALLLLATGCMVGEPGDPTGTGGGGGGGGGGG